MQPRGRPRPAPFGFLAFAMRGDRLRPDGRCGRLEVGGSRPRDFILVTQS